MDFNDTPEEAAFRKEVRAWLDANATRKSDDKKSFRARNDDPNLLAKAREWQAKKAAAGYARVTWPKTAPSPICPSGLRNCVWLKMLKVWNVNSRLLVSPIGVSFWKARSVLSIPGPQHWLRVAEPRLPRGATAKMFGLK